MVKFSDNELEIAIVTYNRCEFINLWLNLCYPELIARNIVLSIYDSSSDDNTKKLIQEFNINSEKKIQYYSVESDVEIGYKPMLTILNSKAKYVWVSGDSRYHDFDELDNKVFSYLKKNMDFVLICTTTNMENDGKIYTDCSVFLKDCLISTTCIGLSIYKTEIFDSLKNDKIWMQSCDNKYRHNYGFGWLGYFYEVIAGKNYKKAFSVIQIYDILPEKKKQAWAGRFYGCWVEDLCELIDYLPDVYEGKYNIPHETWEKMHLDSYDYCYRARICDGLNKEVFQKYFSNGMLSRVTGKIKRIRFFATMPLCIIKIFMFIRKVIKRLLLILRRSDG